MLKIPKKKLSEHVQVYFIRQLPDGREKSGYFTTTIGNLHAATNPRNDRELAAKGFLWLHATFEINGFVVALGWTPPCPVSKGGWLKSHQLTTWSYRD